MVGDKEGFAGAGAKDAVGFPVNGGVGFFGELGFDIGLGEVFVDQGLGDGEFAGECLVFGLVEFDGGEALAAYGLGQTDTAAQYLKLLGGAAGSEEI